MKDKDSGSVNKNGHVNHIGFRIKEIRRELRISQKDFAEAINISGSFLSEVEAGKSKPGYEFLNNVTQRYDINPMYLLTGEGGMFQSDKSVESLDLGYDYGNITEMVKEMLIDFRRSPFIAMATLAFYKEYVYQNRDMIKDYVDRESRYDKVDR
jgi:transcriptional regulator with XRE-family HTH domain